MRTDCIYSPVCTEWISNIHDCGGYYTKQCRDCGQFLARSDLVKSITGYTPIVRKFLETEDYQ